MTSYSKIISKDNSLIKHVVRLANDHKFRQQEHLAVIYGQHLVEEAIFHNIVDKIFILEDDYFRYQKILDLDKQKIYLVNNDVINKLNVLESTVSIVATIKTRCNELQDSIVGDALVLENIQDPGNLGTILRAACASGIKNVIVSKNSVDIYNPKVLRSSQGIQFAINIINNIDLLEWLPTYDGVIFALTPHATSSLYEQNLTQKCAFVLGNEGSGLSRNIMELIRNQIKIPMMGNAESLNLAMAATVAMFEMSRQRLDK